MSVGPSPPSAKERHRAERNQRRMRHSVIACFAIVGGFMAFALFGLWSLGSGRVHLSGWEHGATWVLVSVGGAIVASVPVRFVFWLFQRPRRMTSERP